MLKTKSNKYITVKLRGDISKFTVPGPSTPAPILFQLLELFMFNYEVVILLDFFMSKPIRLDQI